MAVSSAGAQAPEKPAVPLLRTYVRLADYGFKPEHDRDANAVLVERPKAGPNARFVVISTHPKNRNNFEYFTGDIMAARGYRVVEVNDYGPETAEDLLVPIAAAVRYARSLPGVEKVILVGHSGGGPVLSYYQEIAENGPAACQISNRIAPCDAAELTGMPPADALLLLEANIGAPHRLMALDPAVGPGNPRVRDPALDMYSPANGFDPKTDTARYGQPFLKRYFAGMHARNAALLAEVGGKLKAIEDDTGPFKDDEPLLIPGMSESSSGARINMADPTVLACTRHPHMVLKADGRMAREVVPVIRPPRATPAKKRDTLDSTAQVMTVREFLSMSAVRTTPDFALTQDSIEGIDWRSSGNSPVGNVESIRVPTLVMAGNCMIHFIPLETVFDHSAAPDKEFVAVDGADHDFEACRPEYGDTQKRTFDYVDAWLAKRF